MSALNQLKAKQREIKYTQGTEGETEWETSWVSVMLLYSSSEDGGVICVGRGVRKGSEEGLDV